VRFLPLIVAALLVLVLAAPAVAAPTTKTFRSEPMSIGPYQVLQKDLIFDVPKPAVDGYVTHMEVDVVDTNGARMPIDRLMLHHIVFLNLGAQIGDKHDGTCNSITGFDTRTELPAYAERFYAAGEERAKLRLPDGYGYPTKAADKWAMTAMLMNHRGKTDTAYIQYTITYDTEPKKEVTPYWLDVRNCQADPVYDVPGGKKRGATHRRSAKWTVPESGRIVAAGGHVHGGGKSLTLNSGRCELYRSRPTWGTRDHPFYNVKPVLHEPGPVNMSGFTSATGFPVRKGQRLRLDSNYDGHRPHTRVMGIMVLFLAKDPAAQPSGCGRPADLRDWGSDVPGRTKPPRFKVPLTGLDRKGRARRIAKPPGRRVRVRSGATIKVGDRFFSKPNVSLVRGGLLRWSFRSTELHNVTLASGPRGFSSPNLDADRTYAKRLRKPGTYKLFCALHPVDMTQTVKVVKKKRKRR
jgi:plastocyanin